MREPFFRKQTSCWYVWVDKKMVRLARDKEEAYAKWHRLTVAEGKVNSDTPVVQVLDEFLDAKKSEPGLADRTFDWYRNFIQSFASFIHTQNKWKKLGEVTGQDLKDWVAKCYKKGSASTVHGAMRAVQAAFRWAISNGFILRSNVLHAKKPTPNRREVVVTPDQWSRICDAATDQAFRDLLTILWETGCRPQESRMVEARFFDEPNERWIFPRSMSKGGRFERVVYLPPPALAITQKLVKRYPQGPLLRNSQGNAWNRHSIRCRFKRLRTKLDIPGLCAYVIRHTWITESLKNGVDSLTVGVLAGHVDAGTVEGCRRRCFCGATCLDKFGQFDLTRRISISRSGRKDRRAAGHTPLWA